jgi:hypothetical protein
MGIAALLRGVFKLSQTASLCILCEIVSIRSFACEVLRRVRRWNTDVDKKSSELIGPLKLSISYLSNPFQTGISSRRIPFLCFYAAMQLRSSKQNLKTPQMHP